MTRHRIQATDTLADLALRYRLAGWQGLYFAQLNDGFRQRYPDPWQIPVGAEIGIPATSAEQFYVLQRRCADLQRLEDDVKRLAEAQQQLLVAPYGSTTSANPEVVFAQLADGVVRTTANAVRLLRAPDWASAHRDLALLEDALQRWRIEGLGATASLFSLLRRAVQGVPWAVPSTSAQAWCDPATAQFWAKPFISSTSVSFFSDLEAQRRSVRVMLGAQRAVVDRLVRQLRSLRIEAIMETNHLARLADDGD